MTAFEPEHVFEWSVIGRDDDVSSIWRVHDDRPGDGRIDLEFWFQMGPGRGGLNYAIERMPDKEERIVAPTHGGAPAQHGTVVAGVKELAESAGLGVTGSDGRPAPSTGIGLPARPCPVAESLDLFGDRGACSSSVTS